MRTSSEGELHNNDMEKCRNQISQFFGISDPTRLIFTPGCTYSLNLAILGLPWKANDIVVMSGLEHHAVSRPIRKVAKEKGIRFEIAPYQPDNPFDLDYLKKILGGGRVRLVACTMASNVTGDILPIHEIIDLAHQHDALCVVDVAQTAGIIPIDVEKLGIDLMAFAGHKGLYGPPGVGGLYVAPHIQLRTLAEGGTGADSGKHGMSGKMPATYEVGTHNLPAIAGLAAGIEWVQKTGMDRIRAHEKKLAGQFIEELNDHSDVTVYGAKNLDHRTGVVSINVRGITPKELAARLVETNQIITRAGFHCAPLPHETIGSLPGDGTIRFSFGFYNTPDEVNIVLKCLADIPQTVLA